MTESKYAPSPRWELESIYAGGCAGAPVLAALEKVKQVHAALSARASALAEPTNEEMGAQWASVLLELETSDDLLGQLYSFAVCSASEDVDNIDARSLLAALSEVSSSRKQIDVPLRAKLGEMGEDAFRNISGRSRLAHMEKYLRELRDDAAISMRPELEKLHEELATDGFHAWSRLYDDISGKLSVEVDRGEGLESISTEQAKQLLDSPDPELRATVAKAINVAWASQREVFAAAMNHINGYRKTLYARREVDELEVPLRRNRIGRDSLMTMFDVLAEFRPTMVRFLEAKAKMLGLPKLSYYDLGVSLGRAGDAVTYEETQDFIAEHFYGFSTDLGDFARDAFQKQWIEVEDRPGKRQGGFCTRVPLNGETRIFMTFGGKPSAIQTLAHELGHSYHAWVMRDLPRRQCGVPSTLAETASTFAESIIREASYAAAVDDEVRLGLLDRKLTDAATFVMNIPARFHFERAMYAARSSRELTADDLSELTVRVFDEAYYGGLAVHDEMFWASKLHFYLTDVPFYNFPYSVGYLFSLGLYARAMQEGPTAAQTYVDTLRLTGHKTCEEVAQEALDVDLSAPGFWEGAVALIRSDIETFEQLIRV